jgi:hypothetical protein
MSQRVLVNASRVVLIMLFVAGLAMLGLGVFALLRTDNPEVDGWLRAIFGKVFGTVALGMAAVLGLPSAVGVWAMVGANKPGAIPAMSRNVQIAAGVAGIAATAVTALVVIADGTVSTILNLVLIALVAMATLGLAGATAFSAKRGRAIAAGVALAIVVAGALWVSYRAFISPI